MSMPRPDAESREFFHLVVPDDPRVQTRPMFGNLAAFVNGNMFTGLFGDRVFVRLPMDFVPGVCWEAARSPAQAEVDGDAVQPGAECGLAAETGETSQRLEKRFLGRVLRIVGVAEHAVA